MPLRDYYHRHSRALFWEIKVKKGQQDHKLYQFCCDFRNFQEIIPFGNNFLFRLLFGWLLPVKVSLLKLTQTEGTRELYENNHIIQDLLIPIETLADTIRYFEKQVKVSNENVHYFIIIQCTTNKIKIIHEIDQFERIEASIKMKFIRFKNG